LDIQPVTAARSELVSEVRPPRRVRIGALQIVILLAALVLVGLTWGFTLVSVDTEEREARVHAEGNVANLSRALEWQLNRQLLAIDQTLQILAAEWRNDPIKFDPAIWKKRSTLLGDISLQVYVLDSQGFVISSTRPDLLGLDMSDRDYFQAQRASKRTGLFVGPAIRWKATGRWEINLSRRLDRDDGLFAGAMVVTYDPWALTSMLEQVDLGSRGLIALLGSDGAIRALVSPYQLAPGEDVSSSAMFHKAVERQQGVWTGPSAPDGVERVHAFRRLADQDLTIVIGVDKADALRTAVSWAANARLFAFGISGMVLLMACLLMREVHAARGREDRLANDRVVLEHAYGEAESAKAQAEARTSQLQATLSGMSDGVMMLDEYLRVMQWNEPFAALTGMPRDVLRVGVPMETLLRAQALAGEFGPVDVEAEVRRRMARLRDMRAVGVSERTRPNGRTIELRRSALPSGGYVTVYSDITARKQIEEAQAAARKLAEEATEQKTRFVAIVSHEIRTPLNAVVNSLTLLDQSGLSPVQHRLTDTARQAGDALLDLINDILELSKMEAGRLAMRPTVFDIRPVLEGVQDMFRADAEARGIEIVVDIAADLPPRIRTDCGRLRQVLMNFVSNASKFSLPGLVTIRAARAVIDGQHCILLGVRDQGPRIPDREASHLFQPFSRLDNARNSGAPGTGLGLAICERLTRLMGGEIGVGPAPTGGNEFWLTLPLEAGGVLPNAASAEIIQLPRSRRCNILLVEDIPANHLVTSTLLRREGHRVDVAESGPEALRMVAERPYDLVFMDLIMPGMNGYETTRRLRTLPGPAGHVTIVALTANTAPEDRARCLNAGMNDMIGKPVRPAELNEVLSRILRPATRPAGPGAAATKAEVDVLDMERFADLQRGLPAATLAVIVDQCLQDIQERIPHLHAALGKADPAGIESSAHALAGMAATYGFVAIERKMRRVMGAARRTDIVAATVAAEGIEDDLDQASSTIRLILRDKAA
jgi:signal transduction histidine kinase/FixJ family two-component response regulator/HPt (histidine-containing phosphotransfer) domain-containing protein